MMRRSAPRITWVAALAVLPHAAGCFNAADAPLFQPDWEEHLAAADRRAPELPEAPGPVPDMDAPWMAVKLNGTGPIELSLEEATVLGLRNNRDLAVQQLNPVIAGTFERIEAGVFDPQAFADFVYERERASEVDRGTGTRFTVDGNSYDAAAGVRQELPTGTDVEVGVGQSRDISNRAPEQQEARLGLTVTQQLLRGAGPVVNLASVRQAQFDTLASLYELRGFTEALLADIERTYWLYDLALERIAIFEGSLDLAQRQLAEAEQRIAIGVLSATVAAVAGAEVARREQDLIDARSDMEAWRLRLMRLLNATGVGQFDRPLVLTSKPAAIDPQPLTDLDDRLQLAQAARPDLAEARLRLEQNRLETIVTRNGLLPQLEVFVALGKTGFDDTFGGSFSELDGDTYDLAAGLSFTKVLGNQAARAANEGAYASRRQAAYAVRNLEQLVELEVRLAANEVERARQQIGASRTTRILEEETVRAERGRFDAGTSTALLVAQAQRDLLEAQIAEVEAVVAYRLALIDLYVAEGSLLERRGYVVNIPPW